MSPLLSIEGVSKSFRSGGGIFDALRRGSQGAPAAYVRALDQVSLEIGRGEVVGLIGESGSGKSTLGRIASGILRPDDGAMTYAGKAWGAGKPTPRALRLKVQMVFQDPASSLPPRLRVGEVIGEAPRVHRIVTREQLNAYVAELMTKVGLAPEGRNRYPHQFSGGQRQRIAIARALAVRPQLLVCDEVVSALDVSVQAQIINLFLQLRSEYDLTYLFISHDLGVVRHISDRVVIMYLGRVLEQGPTHEVFAAPNHPYTRALLAETPSISAGRRRFATIKGEIPSPMNPPPGCHFHPRCPHAFAPCMREQPALIEVAGGHLSACHLNERPVSG